MSFLNSISTSTQPVSGASTFTMRELTGAKRALNLRERGLPIRHLEAETIQRVNVTSLPGYSRKTLTLLGSSEEPIRINGKWSDKYLAVAIANAETPGVLASITGAIDRTVGGLGAAAFGTNPLGTATNNTAPVEFAGQRVQTARDAATIVDNWCRTGQFLEVSWDALAWHGVIKRFRKDWLNSHDLEWEIEFELEGLAETPGDVSPDQATSVSDTASRMQQLADALGVAALPPTFPMATDAFRSLDQAIKTVSGTTQRVADAVANTAKLALAPAAALRQMAALCATCRGQCDDLLLTLRRTVAGADFWSGNESSPSAGISGATSPRSVNILTKLDFPTRMVALSWRRDVIDILRQLRALSAQQQDAFTDKLEEKIQATYTAKQGEDLRDVSKRFYNTPHEWRRIMAFNAMTSPQCAPGQVLLIPDLQNSLDPC